MALKELRGKMYISCVLNIPIESSSELARMHAEMEAEDQRKGRRGTFTRWLTDVVLETVEKQNGRVAVTSSVSQPVPQDANLLISL